MTVILAIEDLPVLKASLFFLGSLHLHVHNHDILIYRLEIDGQKGYFRVDRLIFKAFATVTVVGQ